MNWRLGTRTRVFADRDRDRRGKPARALCERRVKYCVLICASPRVTLAGFGDDGTAPGKG
jgi:hypothetical protein